MRTAGNRKQPTILREFLLEAIGHLEQAGVSFGHGTTSAVDEAAWLVLHALGLPPTDLNSHLDRALTAAESKAVKSLVEKRINTRKPAAYLTNEAWLGKHRFYVDERVIVPRSYIFELLSPRPPRRGNGPAANSLAMPWAPDPGRNSGVRGDEPHAILDLCTGSGCLAILAALRFPKAKVDAADLSKDALAVAKRNVAEYGLEKRIRLVQSDLFSALAGRQYDLIISNPPYVKAASMKKLPEEYRKEPEMALASGSDGLDHTRVILAEARGHLREGGTLVVEIGHNRKALERAYPRVGFRWPKTSGGTGFVFMLRREELL